MKFLVVNADDFGLDPAVNAAVAQAHTEGILTSASLLVGAPHAQEAVEFAKTHPSLGVGIHLCLVKGRAIAPLAEVAALTDADGNLPDSPFQLSVRLASGNGIELAIETELRAQITRFLKTGLRPTHLDTHLHTHIHPLVLKIVAKLAREYGISCVRAPVEPLWPALRCDRQRLPRKLARWMVFAPFGGRSKRELRRLGLRTADRSVGVLDPGHVTESFLTGYLPLLPDGLTEIFLHPALQTTGGGDRMQRDYENTAELAALCSPQVRELTHHLGIRLTNFRELSETTV